MNYMPYMNTDVSGISGILSATITLPPNSTSAELQLAINDAATGDVIQVSNDMIFTGTVTIPLDKGITIRSDTGNNWILLQTTSGRHFEVNGSLTLENITLDGNNESGGVYVVTGGNFTMEEGTIIEKCYTNFNGAGVSVDGGSFIMNGGEIARNYGRYGGGVHINNASTFHMTGGTLGGNAYENGNTAIAYGGGVGVYGGSTFTMDGGAITYNTVDGAGGGGGVYVIDGSTFILNDGTIHYNRSVYAGNNPAYGGGVMLDVLTWVAGQEPEPSSFIMNGGTISYNYAKGYLPGGAGGGGVIAVRRSSIIINSGIISYNETESTGAGVYASRYANVTLSGGSINNNRAFGNAGGGVAFVHGDNSFSMTGGIIIDNYCTNAGGGVAIMVENPTTETSFIMTGGEISGNTAETRYGGGVFINGGSFVMGNLTQLNESNAPIISGNSAGSQGGGVFLYASSMTMRNGKVFGNESGSLGGGICLYNNSTFIMDDGIIGGEMSSDANVSTTSGGGVATYAERNVFTMNGGMIIGNIARSLSSGGGGIYVGANDIATIEGEIKNNSASNNGGGVYVTDTGILEVSGNSSITGNSAPNGNGGGIFTADYDYADPASTSAYVNIITAPTVIFSDNTAIAAYVPPSNALSFTNIGYLSTSIEGPDGYIHPLNNYDINYEGSTRLALYRVTYYANGGIGEYTVTNLASGSEHVVLSLEETGISRVGYTFTGWNTAPNGLGISYSPGDTITITSDITLYAQWTANETLPPTPPPPHPMPPVLCCPPPFCISRCKPCCSRNLCCKPYNPTPIHLRGSKRFSSAIRFTTQGSQTGNLLYKRCIFPIR